MVAVPSTQEARSLKVIPYPSSEPLYGLRLLVKSASDWRLEIWPLPSSATPRLSAPESVASIWGTPLRMIETRLIKRLSRADIHMVVIKPGKKKEWYLSEELALILGLLFCTLAPMRNLDRIRQVADGIEEMGREEARYWLGMALHRKIPAALRMLLITA